MKKGIIFICAVGAMTLSSCGLYSKYEGQTSVDASLYGDVVEEMPSENAVTFGNISWQDVFTDEKLQSLIETALENNTDLRSAELRIEEAANSMKAARLAYLPSLSLTPQGTLSGLVDGSTTYNTYTLPLTASWEVDIFGRITNQKLLAKMNLNIQTYSTQAIRTEIVAGVANLYYTISMLEQQLAIAKATQSSWEESYSAAKAMMEAGMLNQAGLKQIEASLYSVKMAVITVDENLKKAQNALCGVLMMTPQQIEGGELLDVTMPEDFKIGVPLLMLSARPDVMAAEAALAASFYSTNIARSALYPTISLSGSAGWTNSFGSFIFNPAELIYSVVGQLVQPIFNRGLNRAQLKNAKAELEVARMNFEQTLLNAGIEVNDTLTALEAAQSSAPLYASQVEALDTAAESTALLMKHGSTTYLEVLTAQQTLFNAQLGQVSNRFDQQQSLVTLYKALGGGRF